MGIMIVEEGEERPVILAVQPVQEIAAHVGGGPAAEYVVVAGQPAQYFDSWADTEPEISLK